MLNYSCLFIFCSGNVTSAVVDLVVSKSVSRLILQIKFLKRKELNLTYNCYSYVYMFDEN
jgi:hypothetical protein